MHHFNHCPGLPTGHSPFAREPGSLPTSCQTSRKKHARLTSIHCIMSLQSLIASVSSPFLDKTGRFMSLLSLIYCESGNGLANNILNGLAAKAVSVNMTQLNTVRKVSPVVHPTKHITAQNGLATLGFQALEVAHITHQNCWTNLIVTVKLG